MRSGRLLNWRAVAESTRSSWRCRPQTRTPAAHCSNNLKSRTDAAGQGSTNSPNRDVPHIRDLSTAGNKDIVKGVEMIRQGNDPAHCKLVFSNFPVGEHRMHVSSTRGYSQNMTTTATAPLLRTEIGDVLRSLRQDQGRTLREVSSQAQVSLGYLSEVERGQKEASSELLQAITGALGVPLWVVLRTVSDRMAIIESTTVPDTVPDDLMSVALLS